jgi:hypothetical protein
LTLTICRVYACLAMMQYIQKRAAIAMSDMLTTPGCWLARSASD